MSWRDRVRTQGGVRTEYMTPATLSLTGWAHEALSLDEMAELGKRLVEIHARAGVISGRHRGDWTINVDSWATDPVTHWPVHQIKRHHQHGHLADLVNGCIDAYEREFVFTPDELAQIRKQSAA